MRLTFAFKQLGGINFTGFCRWCSLCRGRRQLKRLRHLRPDRRCAAVLRHQLFELCVKCLHFLLCVSVLSLLHRIGIFAGLLKRSLLCLKLLQECVVLLANLRCVLGRVLAGFFLLSGNTRLLSGFFCSHVALIALGSGSLGLCTAALNGTANRGQCAAQYCAADKTLNVLFAGFRISDAQASLQTLKRLLRNFSQAFTTHGHTRLGGVVHSRFAQRLVGNSLGLLGCQLGAHRTEQLAHTGQQRHSGGVNQGLRNGCGNRFTKAGFFQRLTFVYLTGKVGASELARGHSACAQQTCADSNRSGYWESQSRNTCGRRSGSVGQRAAKQLSDF